MYSVTFVVNREFAPEESPICWYPVTLNVGNTSPKEFEGVPGTTRPLFEIPTPVEERSV